MEALIVGKARRLCYFFFFGSGVAALIYEVVWLRLLGLVFGNTTYAISVVLAAYMAGLGVGSYLLGKKVDHWKRPLLVYGTLEIGIGVYAALTFAILHFIEFTYVSFARKFDPSLSLLTSVRFCLSFIMVFLPTFLMGATLPVLVKFFVQDQKGIGSNTALLYGLNTAGAVTGVLLAGFFLLPANGLGHTLYIAVAVNIYVGLMACWLAHSVKKAGGITGTGVPAASIGGHTLLIKSVCPPMAPRWLPLGILSSGIVAMILEIGYTRTLASVLSSSTYAFTIMLSTFLVGLTSGSFTYKRILSKREARLSDWSWLQLAIAISVMLTLPLYEYIGIVTVRLYALTIGNIVMLEVMRFFVCGFLMFIPAFCLGALFPVTVALYSKNIEVVGQNVGFLYLSNTAGNVIGSVATGFLLIPLFGIYHSIQLAIVLAGAMAIAVGLLVQNRTKRHSMILALSAALLAIGLITRLDGWRPQLIASELNVHPQRALQNTNTQVLEGVFDKQNLFYKEGLNSIVTVGQSGENRFLSVNGKVDASTNVNGDMTTQLMLSHLPHLLHHNPKRTLVIGFGSGTTLGASLAHQIERADVVEIEKAVIDAAPFFDSVNHKAYANNRARVIINDGRNHLLIEKDGYDVIVSEPSNPWMAGVSNLFTVDFYELVSRHLNKNGIFCQWMHTYSIAPGDFQMVMASIKQVFPSATLWVSKTGGDYLIIAGNEPIVFDLDSIQAKIDGSERIKEDLRRYEIRSAGGLLSLFVLGNKDLEQLIKGSELNTDNKLLLEFNAPKALYENNTSLITRILALNRTEDYPPMNIAKEVIDNRYDVLRDIGFSYLGVVVNDVNKAFAYFNKSLALNRDDFETYLGLGRAYLTTGKITKAVKNLEKSVSLNPNSAEANVYLGMALTEDDQPERAVEAFNKAIALDDKNWKYRAWQGQLYSKLERWSDAARSFEEVLKQKPDEFGTKLVYAKALRLTGRAKDAVAILEPMRGEFVTFYPIYNELKEDYKILGTPGPMISALEDFAKRNPYHMGVWDDLLRMYVDAGDDPNIDRTYEMAEKIIPHYGKIALMTAVKDEKKDEPVDSLTLSQSKGERAQDIPVEP